MAALHKLTRVSMLVKRNPALSSCKIQSKWYALLKKLVRAVPEAPGLQ
jgi:hypothetical protein